MLWLEQIGGVQNCTANKPFELKVSLVLSQAHCIQEKNLFVSFLMTILSQSLFSFMRRNFMTLSLFTTRHTNNFLFLL